MPHSYDPDHPLLHDRARLERITDNMYLRIQKVISPEGKVVRSSRTGGSEMVLVGGESADSILNAALLALLRKPADYTENWEALSTTIAHRKGVEAIRRSMKGRKAAEDGSSSEVKLVSLDRPVAGGDDDVAIVFDMVDADQADRRTQKAEDEYDDLDLQRRIIHQARRLLSERDREIFFLVTYGGKRFADLEADFGVKQQRIGQIYRAACNKVVAAAKADPEMTMTVNESERSVR